MPFDPPDGQHPHKVTEACHMQDREPPGTFERLWAGDVACDDNAPSWRS